MDSLIIVAEAEEQEDADANIKDIATSLIAQKRAVESGKMWAETPPNRKNATFKGISLIIVTI